MPSDYLRTGWILTVSTLMPKKLLPVFVLYNLRPIFVRRSRKRSKVTSPFFSESPVLAEENTSENCRRCFSGRVRGVSLFAKAFRSTPNPEIQCLRLFIKLRQCVFECCPGRSKKDKGAFLMVSSAKAVFSAELKPLQRLSNNRTKADSFLLPKKPPTNRSFRSLYFRF